MTPKTKNSKAWIMYCYVSFGIAIGATFLGIWTSGMSIEMKAFSGMGLLFSVGSAFTLAKTLRDEHEAELFHHRLDEARTEKLLREVSDEDLAQAA